MDKEKKARPDIYKVIINEKDHRFISHLKPLTQARLHRVIRGFVVECLERIKSGKAI